MPFVSNFPSNHFMACYLCLEAERIEIQMCASVRKPQVIFFLAQLSQGKTCRAQVVLSFARAGSTLRITAVILGSPDKALTFHMETCNNKMYQGSGVTASSARLTITL